MRKTIMVMVLGLLMSGAAWGQAPPPPAGAAKPGRFGADLVLGLPLGDWSDAVSFSIGVLLDFDWVISPTLSVTGRAGYIRHLVEDNPYDISLSTIPLWAGAKLYLAPAGAGRVFVGGEVGLNFNHASSDVPGLGSASNTDTDVGLNAGGGIELGAISIRAWLSFLDLGHAGDSMELMASVGYYFLAF